MVSTESATAPQETWVGDSTGSDMAVQGQGYFVGYHLPHAGLTVVMTWTSLCNRYMISITLDYVSSSYMAEPLYSLLNHHPLVKG